MKLIVDAFGGDHAPTEIIKGCVRAAETQGTQILLSGDRERILGAAAAMGVSAAVGKMEILHCKEILTMEDEPGSILKEKKDSSMAVGLRALLEGQGDAFASAGNSGALVVGSTMIVKRIPGIKRVSFASVIPGETGFFMLSDVGANVDCRPAMLVQFAVMGSIYMKHVMGVENPRVGLVNVGTESHKGDLLRQETYQLLGQTPGIRFVGNVEGRALPQGAVDVAVTDGFNGNVLLKVYEGLAGSLFGMVKDVFKKSAKGKLAAALVMKDMKALKEATDYNEYGGAPIMGAAKPVFKIHGSAKAGTVESALRLTKEYVASNIIEIIKESVAKNGSKAAQEVSV